MGEPNDAHEDYVTKELLMILKRSIKEEKDAHQRYLRGVELAINPEVREMFENLANEELKHASVLRHKVKELAKKLGREEFLIELEKT